MKVIVNAIPLLGANTGIARYLRCLYAEMERIYADSCEFHYFNGHNVSDSMPVGPKNLDQWSDLADLFWKLPAHLAVGIRLGVQAKRQWAFNKFTESYDLYHEAGFFPFKTPPSLKKVFTIHDASILRHPDHHPKERVLFMRMFLEQRAHLAESIITVSHFSKRELIELIHLPPGDIRVTHLAHASSIFAPPGSNIKEQLKEAGLPDKYFLFVGSGDPRKNIEIIPKALDLANLQIPFVNAGWSGWDTKDQGNILSMGYVSDEMLALLYQGAVALIYPSIYEGFGLPVIEAMACGCPVITTREASLPEVAGDAALYLEDPHDASELANLLLRLHADSNLRISLSTKSLQTANNFSWEFTARKTMQVFEETLNCGIKK